ncbi:hypothetical protein B0J12DRAFT_609287 [Macrophomina phaseolina]|uniref:Chromo domain-containing protein n=2 Tax=Macrophomina phaseolina TaxID=35725 RepID=A0ABQ8FV28_9PEZI|nr:hypothetical protein B0J12DRAFT_609287 [Macrophomina phaseolina]
MVRLRDPPPPTAGAKKRPAPLAVAPRKKVPKTPSTAAVSTTSLWRARGILDESARHYRIDWEGVDPATGKRWAPTWEPKRNANAALIQHWKQKRKTENKKRENTREYSNMEEGGHMEGLGKEEEKQKDDQDKDDKEDDEDDDEDDDADIFPANLIVDERKRQYLVTWENEKKPGKVYKNSWVSKGSVSEDLVEAWNRLKMAKKLEKHKKLATSGAVVRAATAEVAGDTVEGDNDLIQDGEVENGGSPVERDENDTKGGGSDRDVRAEESMDGGDKATERVRNSRGQQREEKGGKEKEPFNASCPI